MQQVTRGNLRDELETTLRLCEDQLRVAQNDPLAVVLRNDLSIAISVLKAIRDEIDGVVPARPKGQRSRVFTRYAVDEGERIVMDRALRDRIAEIEDVFARFW